MRTRLICSLLLFAFSMAPVCPAGAGPGDPVLWYTHPAQGWKDALPVRNGRLGAMVFGRLAKDRIQLNEDTVWNGKKRDRVNVSHANAVTLLVVAATLRPAVSGDVRVRPPGGQRIRRMRSGGRTVRATESSGVRVVHVEPGQVYGAAFE